jgi:hypothetical protein
MFVLFVAQSDIRSDKMILVMSMGSLPRKKIPAKVIWYFPNTTLEALVQKQGTR